MAPHVQRPGAFRSAARTVPNVPCMAEGKAGAEFKVDQLDLSNMQRQAVAQAGSFDSAAGGRPRQSGRSAAGGRRRRGGRGASGAPRRSAPGSHRPARRSGRRVPGRGRRSEGRRRKIDGRGGGAALEHRPHLHGDLGHGKPPPGGLRRAFEGRVLTGCLDTAPQAAMAGGMRPKRCKSIGRGCIQAAEGPDREPANARLSWQPHSRLATSAHFTRLLHRPRSDRGRPHTLLAMPSPRSCA